MNSISVIVGLCRVQNMATSEQLGVKTDPVVTVGVDLYKTAKLLGVYTNLSWIEHLTMAYMVWLMVILVMYVQLCHVQSRDILGLP